MIGTAIDELIRHHPLLKDSVFESMKSTLGKIEDLGNAYDASEDVQQWYKLVPVPHSSADEDVVMEAASSGDILGTGSSSGQEYSESTKNDSLQPPGVEEPAQKSHENLVVSFIDVFGRVSSLFKPDALINANNFEVPRGFVSTNISLQRLHRQYGWS